ncbi:MAG: S24 family peptidase [Alphaproteobacteria bacterium]|nr:S24 family peptidase [Alphaproteobacteria bacterium]
MKLDPVRRKLLELVAHRDPPTDLKKASLFCGKNHAYLHQFVHRGTPRKLPEDVRHALALHLGVDEQVLRHESPPPTGSAGRQSADITARRPGAYTYGAPGLTDRDRTLPHRIDPETDPGVVAIPEVRVVAAAGGGAVAEYEPLGDSWFFPVAWLRHELRAKASDLKIISIDGDSMEPVLESGDKVLIDTSRVAPTPPGIFVLHDGLGLVAKQVEFIPNTDPAGLVIKSANPRYQDYERTVDEVNIVGRVIWFARRV